MPGIRSFCGVLLMSIAIHAPASDVSHAEQTPLMDIPCQSNRLLVIPEVIDGPEGDSIKFVATWTDSPPSVIVSTRSDAHNPKVVRANDAGSGKFIGRFFVDQDRLQSFTVDGCQVEWGNGGDQ